jgi:alcohol dehydrogenase
LYKLPADVDPESAVLLSDIFPTGLECGVLNGLVQPGKTVAIVGAGPVGLAALVTAQLYSPSMVVLYDIDDARLGVGKRLGATHTVHANAENAVDSMKLLTDGNGYDTVIEAVGIPLTFEICQQLVAVGGRIANMGVHGTKVDLHLEKLWDRNISESFRSCPLYFWER